MGLVVLEPPAAAVDVGLAGTAVPVGVEGVVSEGISRFCCFFLDEDLEMELDLARLGLGSRAHLSLVLVALDLDLDLPLGNLGCLKSLEAGGGGGRITAAGMVGGRGVRRGRDGGAGPLSVSMLFSGAVRLISSMTASGAATGGGRTGEAPSGGGWMSLILFQRKLRWFAMASRDIPVGSSAKGSKFSLLRSSFMSALGMTVRASLSCRLSS